MINEMEAVDVNARSRTMHDIEYMSMGAVKVTLIEETLRTWHKLAGNCFRDVEDIFRDHMDHLARDHFHRYAHGGLLQAVT